MWLPEFACPECDASVAAARCVACGEAFGERDGIWRFLTAARLAAIEPFLAGYRAVREREGRRRFSADEYRALPCVGASSPHETEWRIRRESYGHLLQRCFAPASERARVLDLGAGCGWLSHRLAELGHRVVAVDVLDDEADGLGAITHFAERVAAVQADFCRLPFAPAQFDVVIFNASLHYAADVPATLRAARRALTPGGALVAMDSPMFEARRDGDAMMAERGDRVHGAGYLTYDALDEFARACSLAASWTPSRGPRRWRIGRRVARLRLGRRPATFGVWVAQ